MNPMLLSGWSCKRLAGCLALVVLLSACGGPSQEAAQAKTRQAAATAVATENASVTGLVKMSETRVSRTVYHYVFQVSITNHGASPLANVTAKLAGAGSGTTVIDGSAAIDSIAPGATRTTTDTITLQHDRTLPFNPAALVWQLSAGGSAGGQLPGEPSAPALTSLPDIDIATTYADSSYATDPASGKVTLRQLVQIGFLPTATVGQLNALLKKISGEVVKSYSGVAVLYVKIPDPGSDAALQAVIDAIEREPYIDYAYATTFAPADVLPLDSVKDAASLQSMASNLAARGHLAWNAMRAITYQDKSKLPVIVIADNFGDGAPAAGLSAFSYATAVDSGFRTTLLCSHGYHVAGIVGATFADKKPPAGSYPGAAALTMEPIDRQGKGYTDHKGNFVTCGGPGAAKPDESRIIDAIAHYQKLGRHVVVNTSFGNSASGGLTEAQATKESKSWLQLLGAAPGSTVAKINIDGYFHAASAGNKATSPARNNMGWTRAALDGKLGNTVVVENRTADTTAPFPAKCLYPDASSGGTLSAFGAQVNSYTNAAGTEGLMSGSSMASPQVAGLAAYLWSVRPSLTSSEIRHAIVSNTRAATGCTDSGASHLDAYAAVLALDDGAALSQAGTAKTLAPARTAILDLNADGTFKDDDAAAYLDAFVALENASAFDFTRLHNKSDPSRFDLNGDGKVGGKGAAPFNIDIDYDAERKHKIGSAWFEFAPGHGVLLDENAVTDLQILCFYAYSKLFSGDIAKFESALSARKLACNGPFNGIRLTIGDSFPNWTGLPATIMLTDLYSTSISRFQIFGNSSTCGSGERGGPLFSASVDTDAIFLGARVATGVPSTLSGPFINRRNCSSFVAYKTVQDPVTHALHSKMWINATGRGQRFGGPAVFDWEYQVRYYSGDPLKGGAGRQVQLGVVPNSGNYSAQFNATVYAVSLAYGAP